MEYSGPWQVKLTYFKKSGKYYTDGEYRSEKLGIDEIFAEVRKMLSQGIRPGLVNCHPFENEFLCLVEVPDHPHSHPALIVPGGAEVSRWTNCNQETVRK